MSHFTQLIALFVVAVVAAVLDVAFEKDWFRKRPNVRVELAKLLKAKLRPAQAFIVVLSILTLFIYSTYLLDSLGIVRTPGEPDWDDRPVVGESL